MELLLLDLLWLKHKSEAIDKLSYHFVMPVSHNSGRSYYFCIQLRRFISCVQTSLSEYFNVEGIKNNELYSWGLGIPFYRTG